MKIVELFNLLRSTASSNERMKILDENMSETVKCIFYRTYNEDKYNIKQLRKQSQDLFYHCSLDNVEDWRGFERLLDDLRDRKITGNEAREKVNTTLSFYELEEQEILINIIQKNLKVGISRDNFQKVLPIFNKDFQVSLAYNLDDVKGVNPIDGTFYASRKLDGCRCICIVETTWKDDEVVIVKEPRFFSRQNKEFTTLDRLKEPIKKLVLGYHYVGEIVFDGEVCMLDENGDEHFDWIMKEVRRKDHTIMNPCYNIFDVLTGDEFWGRTESDDFSTRNFYLLNAFHHLYQDFGKQQELKLLKQERIESQEDFDRWSKYVAEGGWEGFMLRKDVPYRSGRTKDLLKVKKFKDAEYKVLDIQVGKMKYGIETLDVVTNLTIKHKDNLVYVGSGLSKEQRTRWVDHPEEIVGKTVTIQYFEETKDSKTGTLSLRFPVLKYVYDGERDV